MEILCTELYEKNLTELLKEFALEDFEATKKFKIYLDTIILNLPTKAKKYKKSLFFDDENIRDILHESFIIPFYLDEKSETYLILDIIKTQ